ncbi:aryl-alcohol dehydrogenase [Geothrix rubra]|uniref:Aryl-alcohol dehydrogenase n=1 Tax=Geothrix rubra TaxID=2927977 RepID=A0ABQ5Q702_9BACT|nr:aldo/keto reductase [Geothrix rubra]GLH70398.1 aryl-alcohol dehydrogenase [Geothrix rubra]
MASAPVPTLVPEGSSRLALGTMRLLDGGRSPGELAAFLAQAADLGLAVLDSADIYGAGAVEPALGAAFRAAPGLRDRFRIVGKCGIRLVSEASPRVAVKHYDTSRSHVRAAVEGSLRALGTDRLDLLLIHRPDPLMDAHGLAVTLGELVAEGKVLALGVSNFLPAQADLLQARLTLPLAAHQIEASLWRPEPLLDGTLDHAQVRGMQVMAWSPLGGGRAPSAALALALAKLGEALGLTPAQVALAWLARHPSGLLPVVGTGRLDRLREAVAAMACILDREAWFGLLEAARGKPVA